MFRAVFGSRGSSRAILSAQGISPMSWRVAASSGFRGVSSSATASLSTDESLEPTMAENKKGVIEEYGVWPLIGFGSIIAFSKEYVIINQELVLAGLMYSTYFSLYLVLREPFIEFIEGYRADIKKNLQTPFEAEAVRLKSEMEQQKLRLTLPETVKEIAHYRAELAESAHVARINSRKSARALSVKEKLDRIIAFESDYKARKAALFSKLLEAQISDFAISKYSQEKTSFLNAAVKYMETGNRSGIDKFENSLTEKAQHILSGLEKNIPDSLKTKFAEKFEDLKRQDEHLKKLVSKIDN